ncbi:hypothetical protein HCH_05782 [Hahella chejuensis KCTC 2396]|uniref:Uncharacterized protein n=1 Tax=Hahella chejuensis (strain KCTC 2396) TaxID=349521 RepID=Q2SA92_HAHCH|nr:hypothetical protein HCH_05782 [Hahella chejuensis KCTC 2396]
MRPMIVVEVVFLSPKLKLLSWEWKSQPLEPDWIPQSL